MTSRIAVSYDTSCTSTQHVHTYVDSRITRVPLLSFQTSARKSLKLVRISSPTPRLSSAKSASRAYMNSRLEHARRCCPFSLLHASCRLFLLRLRLFLLLLLVLRFLCFSFEAHLSLSLSLSFVVCLLLFVLHPLFSSMLALLARIFTTLSFIRSSLHYSTYISLLLFLLSLSFFLSYTRSLDLHHALALICLRLMLFFVTCVFLLPSTLSFLFSDTCRHIFP